MLEIDGSVGEGGGQIIRTALSLSAITKKPFKIFNIRANRPKPGLQPQHLMATKAVRNICRGKLNGAELESTELSFEPGPIIGGKYDFDIGTAGSTILLAQTIIPILNFAEKESEITIHGGTHVTHSPSYDYFERVFVPAIRALGIELECQMKKVGYYPKGGGEIQFQIKPSKLSGLNGWPKPPTIETIIRRSGIPLSVAIREKKIFIQNNHERVYLREDETDSVGNAITCFRGFCGSYILGEKGKRAEIVAQEALDNLIKETGDVDLYLADQLMLYAALAEGKTTYSTSEVSNHSKTNAEIISKFIEGKIIFENNSINPCIRILP